MEKVRKYMLLTRSREFFKEEKMINHLIKNGRNQTRKNIFPQINVSQTDLGAGYPCFVVSICMIGVCTAVIGDVAGHLGCFIYLKDSVNAIAFVALGTSVPGNTKNSICQTPKNDNAFVVIKSFEKDRNRF